MLRVIIPLTPAAAALALGLASCGASDPVAPEANNLSTATADLGNEAANGVDSASSSMENSEANGPPPPADGTATAIPAGLHGRWGMVPADCTSTRGDAKGLLTIDARQLRFYESTARPVSDIQTSADSISGNFDFTGEGMNWSRYQSLEIQDSKLVRSERDPSASYTYVRCD